ncbi:MAG: glutathione S-transferase family protein [Deltaproteobacteria bacterium]|nr:MAG: glutathione S-transferase family protein [Deltaproteobacteria bacterium]
MILHIANKNYSSWSLRPWVLLRALDIPFEERLHLFGRESFHAFSPTGCVPCLHDGKQVVWDSLAIAEHVAEDHARVWPDERAARSWARSAAAEMHSGFAALREQCSMTVGQRIRLHEVGPALERDLRRLEALLGEGLARFGGPWLAGPAFTAVDAFYAPVAYRVQTYDLALTPAVAAYMARLRAHPAMRDWERAALAETVRDEPHEDMVRAWGTVVEDLRAR